MTIRIVKVQKPVYPPDGPWRIFTESGDLDETIRPDPVNDRWLIEAVGGRMFCYFKAERSADGWKFKERYKGPKLHW